MIRKLCRLKLMGIVIKSMNVSPFGGCLPLLIQMPIFIAFLSIIVQI